MGKKTLFVVFAVILTLVVLVAVSELLQIMPVTDTEMLVADYWRAPWQGGLVMQHAGFWVFMLGHIWVLWLIPLMALVLVAWFWKDDNEEEVSAYLERLHVAEQALRETSRDLDAAVARWDGVNRKLDEVFENSNDVWVVVDMGKGIRRWNRAALEWAKRQNAQLMTLEGHLMATVVDDAGLGTALIQAAHDSVVWRGEVRAHGNVLMVTVFPLGDEVAVVMRDISQHQGDVGYLQNMEAALRQLVEGMDGAVAVLDLHWNYMYVSAKWAAALGIVTNRPLVGGNHKQLAGDFPQNIKQLEQKLLMGETVGRDDEPRVVAGREMVVGWAIRLWRDARGQPGGFIFQVKDITETARLRRQVAQAEERENTLAYSDALTGLPNRQLFQDRLNMALAQAYRQLGKVALFFLDLDGFKQVNDQLGHDHGDLLLKQVGDRLKTCVRQTDTVARLGGDEFTIILGIRDQTDAEQVAKKVLEVLSRPYDLNGKIADHVGTSIGIALYPQDGTQAGDLMRKADGAMYAAKQAGKRTYRWSAMEVKS